MVRRESKLAQPHDVIVRRIMDEMLDGEWTAGPSHQKYMAEFGVGFDAVKRWASEANLFLKIARGTSDDIRERILVGVDTVQRKSLGAKRHIVVNGEVQEVSAPDNKTYLASLEFLARCHGVDKPKETPTESVSEEELADLLRARGYEVKPPTGPVEE